MGNLGNSYQLSKRDHSISIIPFKRNTDFSKINADILDLQKVALVDSKTKTVTEPLRTYTP